MTYFIIIGVTAVLLAGFLLMTAQERRIGVRLIPGPRLWLDRRVARGMFIVKHVDWSAFIAHLVHTVAAQIAHDLAHGTLIIVRALERTLTRTVRYFREQRRTLAPGVDIPDTDIHPLQRVAERLRQMAHLTRRPRTTVPPVPSAADESRGTTGES